MNSAAPLHPARPFATIKVRDGVTRREFGSVLPKRPNNQNVRFSPFAGRQVEVSMDDPWERLHATVAGSLQSVWCQFAKDGTESAVLAPLAEYPNAAGWLAGSMAISRDHITRKLGAMLAGWITDPRHAGLLSEMLETERHVFNEDPLMANSVGEDIMFAATRWTQQPAGKLRHAGIDVLAEMIGDALEGIPWNTVHWALANLHSATNGDHEIFDRLRNTVDEDLDEQPFLKSAVQALKASDRNVLDAFMVEPSPRCELAASDPRYALASDIWDAAAAAEASLA
jgi:hypothetical protein